MFNVTVTIETVCLFLKGEVVIVKIFTCHSPQLSEIFICLCNASLKDKIYSAHKQTNVYNEANKKLIQSAKDTVSKRFYYYPCPKKMGRTLFWYIKHRT